ncbi:MAG: sulfite exporter TauE/SafE family protein [Candidatus Thiodiazotropha sp.]|nr:sulfite exporter TauE/SafE family protein [Candidatus Thiodiazotropha taylori]MBT3059933.1 sulfite exporter TauE/SafE family protein [Candidatus Thiodiazotropha sp. (ex Lucina pensylvanica)]MBV2096119.1 sulfite exporter TauE/SafE family protein [Candidatus Thiodiazotropha sp. (ex Codakia orbicularis)]PUB78279.1 MAG: sulfite exporter TauE/SafE family protein [gamma proteobacterium symbiont of Ctena orbiculata]MBT3062215.1 sulfite exporter TauE/SafE family protein [Candidatus Thiodiazotropha s
MEAVIESLTLTHLLFAAVVISLAYLVRGIAGFGSGLIAIPLLALILPLTTAVPLIVFLDYMASASHGIKHREAIKWNEILSLLPFAVVGVLTALFIFKSVDMEALKIGLGAFILVFAVYSLFSFSGKELISSVWSVPAGSMGGLIGTLYGTGGPFYVLYLKFRKIEKTQFRATFATIFLLDGAGRLAGYLFTGFFTLDLVLMMAVAIPLMVIGMFIGGRIHTNMSQQTFQRAISMLLVFSGLALLLK